MHRMGVTHFEHTDGHDKGYRIFGFEDRAVYAWGRRGALNSAKLEIGTDGRDQVRTREHRGYRQVFSFVTHTDILPTAGTYKQAARGLVTRTDQEWADLTAARAHGDSGIVAITDWTKIRAAQPFVAALADRLATSEVIADDRAAFVVPLGATWLAIVLRDTTGLPAGAHIGPCDTEHLTLALRLWEPAGQGTLASFDASVEAARTLI